MGIFDGMNAVQMGRRYLDTGGTYIVKVQKCGSISAGESHKGIPAFYVELEVMASDMRSCPVGTLVSWSVPIKPEKQKADLAKRNIKQFLAAVLGMMNIFEMPDPVSGIKPSAEQIAEAACASTQPFAGRQVIVKVSNTKTKEGNDFSVHTWAPLA